MEKALNNLDSIFASDTTSWHIERKFWVNCFRSVERMSNSGRIFKRIANASKETIGDYLTEVQYAVFFSKLGFRVVVEPLGSAGPDIEVILDNHSSAVEITRFRRIYEGPPESSITNDQLKIAEYGNSKRDVEKAYNKIVGKFRQINKSETATSIIAIWNSDGDLEEIEMKEAIRHLRRDSDTNKIPLPPSLAFVVFGPWDGRFWCFMIRSVLTPYEKEWIERLESMNIGMFKDRVLNVESSG